MAIVGARDAQTTGALLGRFLAEHVEGMADPTIEVIGSPGGTGFSSDTLMFDVVTGPHDARRRRELVARVAPTGYSLYRDHDLETQWRVIDALHRHTDVPVPGIIAHDTSAASILGAPFFVMDRVRGVPAADSPPYTVKGWLHDATPSQQRDAWTAMWTRVKAE